MVLVDTSVWVRFLANRAPFAGEVDRLLDASEVAGHELIYGELLIGDPGGRLRLLELYLCLPRLATVRHGEVVEFVKARRLHGRGIGWVDAHVLASTLLTGSTLWTADERLVAIADELGVGYGRLG